VVFVVRHHQRGQNGLGDQNSTDRRSDLKRMLAAAGRQLFQASRQSKARANDADRLRKYLARFDLQWDGLIANPTS
jgi:sigma54-dependent transcription regulator